MLWNPTEHVILKPGAIFLEDCIVVLRPEGVIFEGFFQLESFIFHEGLKVGKGSIEMLGLPF